VDRPELSDEAIVRIKEFLQDLINRFESQNNKVIKRYYRALYNEKEMVAEVEIN